MKREIKKFVVIALVMGAVSFMLIAGCQKKAGSKEEASLPEGVAVKGKEIAVTYEENPTTGYEWTYEIDNEETVQYVSDSYKAEEGKEEKAGAGGVRTFQFEAGKPGQADITMKYAQNWEGGQTDQKITLHVTVSDSGDISVQ